MFDGAQHECQCRLATAGIWDDKEADELDPKPPAAQRMGGWVRGRSGDGQSDGTTARVTVRGWEQGQEHQSRGPSPQNVWRHGAQAIHVTQRLRNAGKHFCAAQTSRASKRSPGTQPLLHML